MNAIPPRGLKPARAETTRKRPAAGPDDAAADVAAGGSAPRRQARGSATAAAGAGIEVALDDSGFELDPGAGDDPEGLPDPAMFAGFVADARERGGSETDQAALAEGESGRAGTTTSPGSASGPGAGPGRNGKPAAAAQGPIPGHIAAIEVLLSVEVGRARVPLAELLAVEAGQLFDLDTLVAEPVSILANGRPFATGEIVAVGERFGVRIVSLAEPGA
jgi:flagellar motor switch protein FliN/FliY